MKNDEKILELKSQIDIKKETLKKQIKKFSPMTNCIIDFEGVKNNLQVLNKEQLVILLVKLNSYLMSAKNLELTDIIMMSGYSINEWIVDIKNKLEVMAYKEEENKLKFMEDKLHKLLSDEKKTELEIDEIENMLK